MRGLNEFLVQEAGATQVQALVPGMSVWISANAGTGKTEVLTRRMLAMLLSDKSLEPRQILALTFTKAGAAEMAARLPKRLEEWAKLDEAALSVKVAELGLAGHDWLPRVRELAAMVRKAPPLVATIHGLAQQVLGRFAVEAGFVPDFEVLEEGAQKRLLQGIQHELLVHVDGALAETLGTLLDELGDFGWDELTKMMVQGWHKFEGLMIRGGGLQGVVATLEAKLGVDVSGASARPLIPTPEEHAALERVWAVLPEHGAGDVLRAPEVGLEAAWREFLLTTTNTARAKLFLKGELSQVDEQDVALLMAAAVRAEAQLRARKVYRGFDVTRATLVWAAAVRGAYLQRKREHGWVDYQDLLDGLERVMGLADGGASGWVWYGLDRRFRHLVVDEAQDNNPQQDRIVQWLAKSVLSGDVGEGQARTVLAVGDMKQSIFRFQGAVPKLFLELRAMLGEWAPETLRIVDLTHSFRSGRHVLALVDKVFETQGAVEVMGEDGEWPTHRAVADSRLSRVELWEPVAKVKGETVPPWSLPEVRAQAGGHGEDILFFEQVGNWLREQVGRVMMPSTGKPLTFDDVMLVVQRNKYADMAAGVLRRQGIPVAAGGKVLPPSVEDVVALVRVVFNRADNLALAQVLKGLRGWADGRLMQLAGNAVWRDAVMGQDDVWLAGYEALAWEDPLRLVQGIVGEMGFEGQLFESLLLWAEQAENLGQLVSRLELDDLPVVAGTEGVRILTVHGAKGLQAPLVVLPDTMSSLGDVARDKLLWGEDVVLYKQGKTLSVLEDSLIEAEVARKRADSLRGLYVAMTRAVDWLVVGGFGNVGETTDTWWTRVKAAMGDAEVEGDTFEVLEGGEALVAPKAPALPGWWEVGVAPVAPVERNAAQVRGELVHGVLQGVMTSEDEEVLAEVQAVKDACSWVFVDGGRWEMDVAVDGRVRRVDRVVEKEGVWWVIDFKTGAVPETVPAAYVAQLRAYTEALRATWPQRRWQAAVLWTAARRLDEVDVG